jgi:hypothetical protein
MNTQIVPRASGLCGLVFAMALAAGLLATFTGERASAATTDVGSFEGETMTWSPNSSGEIANNATASARKALDLWSSATASKTVTLPSGGDGIRVRASGTQCNGSTQLVVKVDGTTAINTSTTTYNWRNYSGTLSPAASGPTQVQIVYADANTNRCDSNLWIDKVTFTTSGTTEPPVALCADGLDNDGDSKIDYPNDPGCTSATDNDETNPVSLPTAHVSLGVFAGQSGGDGGAWESSTMTTVHQFEQQVGAKPKMVHMFFPMYLSGSCADLPPGPATALGEGYKPLLTWEVLNYGGSTTTNFSYSAINSGSLDGCFRQFADQVKTLNGPLYLRPFHEMNGGWYPWAVAGKEQAHINAWRRMVNMFRAQGANNVKFVWCPNVRFSGDAGPYANYYPGDAYVDYLCLDGYNWASANGSPWQSFDQIYRSSYNEIIALPSSDPLIIGEYASHTGLGDKAQWLNDMRARVKSGAYPRLKVLNWFNQNRDNATWQVDSSQAVLDAYKAFAADSYFKAEAP